MHVLCLWVIVDNDVSARLGSFHHVIIVKGDEPVYPFFGGKTAKPSSDAMLFPQKLEYGWYVELFSDANGEFPLGE